MSNYSALLCPQCKSPVKPTDNDEFFFCPYCDSYFKDDQIKRSVNINMKEEKVIKEEKTIKKIDEAEVLKQKNEADKMNRKHSVHQSKWTFFSLLLIIIFICVAYKTLTKNTPIMKTRDITQSISTLERRVAALESKEKKLSEREVADAIKDGMICPGVPAYKYRGKDYMYVQKTMEALGFTAVEIVGAIDSNFLNHKDEVLDVSIGGIAEFDENACFSPDSKVVISYKINEPD